MATRPGERQRDYRDLRERTERHERWREEHLQRIVESQRERQLHSLQAEAERALVHIPDSWIESQAATALSTPRE